LFRRIIAALCLIVGVVWIVQGVGVLHGSFMTGHAVWAVLGAVLVVVGAGLLRGEVRARRRSQQGED
jgi:uncharacterized membrane protein HdeD (DUF308 family)